MLDKKQAELIAQRYADIVEKEFNPNWNGTLRRTVSRGTCKMSAKCFINGNK